MSDVGRYSAIVFKPAYDAAPKGQKTQIVERLRHALVYAMTDGRTWSLNDLEPLELVKVDATLRHIAEGTVHDDEGVTFVLTATNEERDVRWADLDEAQPAA